MADVPLPLDSVKAEGGPHPHAQLPARLQLPAGYYFKIEGDFEQSDGLSPTTRTGFSATDVFINWHGIPEANLKVGQWKAPFGLEQITPDATIFTIERSRRSGS